LALNDTYFFTCQGTLSGRNYVHTLHFRELAGPITGNPAQDLINTWQTACQTQWIAAHPPAYTLVRLTAQRICGTLPLPSRVEEGVGAVGVRPIATDLLPPWLAICVNESTGLAGKRWHGRFFISGGAEADIVGETLNTAANTWLATTTAYVAALSTRFVNQAVPLNWELVTHSRMEQKEHPSFQCTQTSTPVTGLGIVTRLTSQRSRRA
jgi:hypothetical protein